MTRRIPGGEGAEGGREPSERAYLPWDTSTLAPRPAVPIELLAITNDPEEAARLWAHEAVTTMVDLERTGKPERQRTRDTVLSAHALGDVERLSRREGRGPLLVRIEAVEHGGLTTVPLLCDLGVDRVMLPMFRDRKAVDEAVEALRSWGGGRVRLTLLAETEGAVQGLDEILRDQPPWLEGVHVGLNDLSLERGTPFLFEPLRVGELDRLAEVVKGAGRRFGFGGVGAPGTGLVPGEEILGEHVRIGSDAVILSRTFRRGSEGGDPDALDHGIRELRAWEERWRGATAEELGANRERVRRAIERVSAQWS